MGYLDFKDARCKNCYKCLRECPVKAIRVVNHQAKIIEEKCILCGKCTLSCPQNAKEVHTEINSIKKLLKEGGLVYASVAPSFVASFGVSDFSVMQIALGRLGFSAVEETAIGAKAVTEEYEKLLKTGEYKNFITSACPAVNRFIQIYYPDALKYLAKVDSPMLAHAKMIKKVHPQAKVVFIGPCIAKKREGEESGVVDGVLTFEDLKVMLEEKNIVLGDIYAFNKGKEKNKARIYPIDSGIIKSMSEQSDNYEYISVSGASNCAKVLENIESLSNMFLEMNICEFGCINGPCSLVEEGLSVKANGDVRRYATKTGGEEIKIEGQVDLSKPFDRIRINERIPLESEIKEILAKTGKYCEADELNCGACGYPTCRDKAFAVANGYAALDMCLPYMRERAESMSYEVIKHSPHGVIVVDSELKIVEINDKAKALCNITESFTDNLFVYEYLPSDLFFKVLDGKSGVFDRRINLLSSNSSVDLTIIYSEKQRVMFAFMKDVTKQAKNDEELANMKLETLKTTDEVIKKQMRVAQEIASLLGETTAETKVALLKLKSTLADKKED